jgi:hypothetical protein
MLRVSDGACGPGSPTDGSVIEHLGDARRRRSNRKGRDTKDYASFDGFPLHLRSDNREEIIY